MAFSYALQFRELERQWRPSAWLDQSSAEAARYGQIPVSRVALDERL
jgi:hypothetical protein